MHPSLPFRTGDAALRVSGDLPAAPRSWGAVVGLTIATTLGVILLEGLAPGEFVSGAALVALVVLSSAIILGDRLRDGANVPEMLRDILDDRSLMNRLRLVGVIVLLGPVGEELALRGWLQGQLERRWSVTAAVVTAGVVFAVMHGVDARIFYFVILGIMFGAAVVAFRSLWASIALHMTVNGMVVVPLLLADGSAVVTRDQVHTSPWLGGLGLLLAVPLYRRWLRAGARRRAIEGSPPVAVALPEPGLD